MKKIILLYFMLFSLVFAKQEQRLVVLDPASIETLFMLESGDKIVGIASLQHSNIYPENKTSSIESVGTFSNPSLEKIVALKPSLVILSSYSLNLEEGLKNFGIKSVHMKADKIEDIKNNIIFLSKLMQKEKEGKMLLEKFEAKLQELQKNPIGKSGIYLYSSNPLMAFSKDSLIADILTLIGVENLNPQTDIKRPVISSEFILKQNPQILILGINADNVERFLESNPLLKNTEAAKNHAIYFNPKTHILLRLSPKITDRIEDFKNKLIQGKF